MPYSADTAVLLAALTDLDWPILFDSGCRRGALGFAEHGMDLLAACPAVKLYHQDQAIWCQQSDLSRPARISPPSISAVIGTWVGKFQLTDQPAQPGPGWLGCLGYDAARLLTPGVRWHQAMPQHDCLALGFYPCVIMTDHGRQTTELVWLKGYNEHAARLRNAMIESVSSPTDGLHEPGAFRLTRRFAAQQTAQGYQAAFARIQEHIHAGDCYQVNLTQSFTATCEGSALAAYRLLRNQHQAPMGGYFDTGKRQLLSLSPERFVQGISNQWSTSPIKGTRPRGSTPDQDQCLALALAASEKDRAENVMIVDLLRNDLGRFAIPGSVKVAKLFAIESFANVHHLVSTIAATRRDDISQWQALLQCFPGGSITGAPKLRAMEIIDQRENHYRDWYCGSLLMLSCTNYLDSNILIRSLVVQDHVVRCWAGGGIVADSESGSEYQESLTKIATFMQCLESTLSDTASSA